MLLIALVYLQTPSLRRVSRRSMVDVFREEAFSPSCKAQVCGVDYHDDWRGMQRKRSLCHHYWYRSRGKGCQRRRIRCIQFTDMVNVRSRVTFQESADVYHGHMFSILYLRLTTMVNNA